MDRERRKFPQIQGHTTIDKTSGLSEVTVTQKSKKRFLDVNTELPQSAFGQLLVVQPSPIFQGSFEYTVDNTDLTSNVVTNGGTVTQAEAMAVVTSSTTTNSTACLQSVRHAKYRPGQGSVSSFTALFTTGVTATEQLIGLADETGSSVAFKNGYMVGFIGDTFGVHRFANDVVASVTAFNVDALDGTGESGMTIDPTKINVFDIRFQYLGAGEIQFCIEDPNTGRFIVFHRIEYANKNIVPSVDNPNFHHTMWVDNKATTDNLILKSSSYGYFIEGLSNLTHIHQPQNSSGSVQKTSVTSEVAIFTIRSRSLYAGKTNFIDIIVEAVSASIKASAANNLGTIRIVRDTTLGGVPSFSDINTNNSVIEIDTAGTTLTGGVELFSFPLAGKNDKLFEKITELTVLLSDGETITVAGSSAANATINASVLWKELF